MSEAAVEIREEHKQRTVVRPTIPVIGICAIAMWTGILIAEEVSWQLYCLRPAFSLSIPCLVALCIFAVQLAVALYTSKSSAPIVPVVARLACALSLGLLVGTCYWMDWQHDRAALDASVGKHRIEIVSDARKTDFGYRSKAIYLARDGSSLPITVYWSDEEIIREMGETFWVFGKPTLSSSVEVARLMHRNGEQGTMSVYYQEDISWANNPRGLIGPFRAQAKHALFDIEGDGAALVSGVVFGDRSRLDGSKVEQAFRICGLSHLIAVSGTHLVVIGALFGWVLSALRLTRIINVFLLVFVSLVYLLLSGLQISAIRAIVMMSAAYLAPLAGRKRNSLSACSICCMGMLGISPSSALSLSFLLSVAAAAGIVLFTAYVQAWFDSVLHGCFSNITQPLALTIVAQIVTFPITVPVFGVFSLISPLANLIVAPLVACLLGIGLFGTIVTLFSAKAGVFLLTASAMLGNMIETIAGILANIPYASMALPESAAFVVLSIAGICLVWIVWPTPSRRRCAKLACGMTLIALLVVICAILPAKPQVIMLDVGQGDAIVIRDGAHTLLVDTGEKNGGLVNALANNRISHLDAVIVTHLHTDHYGALSTLSSVIPTKEVYLSAPTAEAPYKEHDAFRAALALVGNDHIGYLKPGDTITVGHFTLDVLWPHEFTEDGGNADSICILLSYDAETDGTPEADMLLVGDAEKSTLAALRGEGSLQQVDILKVGHHGSKASLDEALVDTLDARIALVSVGEDNEYGHPAQETVQLLQSHGAKVYRTDRQGSVTVTFSKDTIDVSCDSISSASSDAL